MWCLLAESPWIPDEECDRLDDNRRLVVERGRDPELKLSVGGRQRYLRDWSHDIFAELDGVAELLDTNEEGTPHRDALAALAPRLDDPELTPSGQLYSQLVNEGVEYLDQMRALAEQQAAELREAPMDRARQALFAQLVETSHQQQADIEAAETRDFAAFLDSYFARARESPRIME